jgi:hypothetical protein
MGFSEWLTMSSMVLLAFTGLVQVYLPTLMPDTRWLMQPPRVHAPCCISPGSSRSLYFFNLVQWPREIVTEEDSKLTLSYKALEARDGEALAAAEARAAPPCAGQAPWRAFLEVHRTFPAMPSVFPVVRLERSVMARRVLTPY